MKQKKKHLLAAKQGRYGYIFCAPWIIGLLIYVAYPFYEAVHISFSKLTVGESGYLLDGVGFSNYKYAFGVHPQFTKYLISSFGNMFYQVPLVVIFSFFLASVVNMDFKGRGIVRSVLFLPVIITSGSLNGLLTSDYMSQMESGSSGTQLAAAFLNTVKDFDFPDALVSFLAQSVGKIYEITCMSAVPIVIFLAALQSISDSVYEAAYIEGASAWEVFWKIKFPLVSPHILVCVVYCIIDNLNTSSNPVVSTIKGTTYGAFEYGYGAAMSVAYMLIILLVLGVVYRIISKLVVYSE